MKPIEEGCLAIVVGGFVPGNLGKCVKVGKRIGHRPFVGSGGERGIEMAWVIAGEDILDTWGNPTKVAPERFLLRIDDPGLKKETRSEEELTHE